MHFSSRMEDCFMISHESKELFSLALIRKLTHSNMLHWNLVTLSSLLAIASGHVAIDGSKGSSYDERDRLSVIEKDFPHHRTLALEKELKLQINWWNWAYCAKPYSFDNANFTPMSGLVPDNTVFLAGYPTFKIDNSSTTCKSKTITRSGTISTGQQTVFFPLSNLASVDSEDDWEKNCTLKNNTDALRIARAKDYNLTLTNLTLTGQLYLHIDGKDATPFYLYDEAKSYLSSCNDKNQTLTGAYPSYDGDTCDFEPFETIGGMDIDALVGWYGIDTRTWFNGDTHTYEFGSLSQCITTKYILTAIGPLTKAPTKAPSKAPTKAPTKVPTKSPTKAPVKEGRCGLFGLGIFCPLAWLKWFFGLFK